MQKVQGCIILRLMSKRGGWVKEEKPLRSTHFAVFTEQSVVKCCSVGLILYWMKEELMKSRCSFGGSPTASCVTMGEPLAFSESSWLWGVRELAWVKARPTLHLMSLRPYVTMCRPGTSLKPERQLCCLPLRGGRWGCTFPLSVFHSSCWIILRLKT